VRVRECVRVCVRVRVRVRVRGWGSCFWLCGCWRVGGYLLIAGRQLRQPEAAPGPAIAICHLPSGLDSTLLSSMGLAVRLCSQSAHHGGPAAR
jgi:hypothetical protein